MLNKVTWKRWRISQEFWENPKMYAQFWWKGHNGIDLATPVGTHIFSTHDGIAEVLDDKTGYGLHVKIKRLLWDGWYETIYAHLSKVYIKNWPVGKGVIIGKSGNTGNSTWPHLHFWLRFYNPDGSIKDKGNGYWWWVNPRPYFLARKI